MTLPPLPTPDLLLLGQLQSPVEGWTRSQVDAYGAACRAAALEEIAAWLDGQGQPGYAADVRSRIRALKDA